VDGDFNNKFLVLNFKYYIKTSTLQVLINNDRIVKKHFAKIKLNLDSSKRTIIGNSLQGFYGARIRVHSYDFNFVQYLRSSKKHLIRNIASYNFRNKKGIWVDDNNRVGGLENDEPIIELK